MDCHTKRTTDGVRADPDVWLAGDVPFGGPWGKVYSVNLTEMAPELAADDLERIIRGEQHFLYPMPTGNFINMAHQDMDDLIAYLQTVPLKATVIPPNRLNPDFKLPAPFLPPLSTPDTAPSGVTVARGAYLVEQAGCGGCHTPQTADGQDEPGRLLAGGTTFQGLDGKTIYSRNLTPDPETGLGRWSDEDIIRAVRQGVTPDGHSLNPIMPYGSAFHVFSDEDIQAVVAYLRSIPPVRHVLPENPVWQPPTSR